MARRMIRAGGGDLQSLRQLHSSQKSCRGSYGGHYFLLKGIGIYTNIKIC